MLGFYFCLFFYFVFIIFVHLGVVDFLWGRIGFFLLYFLNQSCPQTYDSWRHRHVEPDESLSRTLEIRRYTFFSTVQSLRTKMAPVIGKTFIPIQPSTLLKQRAKPSTQQILRLPSVVLFLSNMVVGDGQEAWQMLLRGAPRWRPALQWHSKDKHSLTHPFPSTHPHS